MNYTFNEGDNATITAEFIDYLENLKKENQQLEEKYNIRTKAYNHILLENANLKSILDEIRKYIDNLPFKDLIPIEVKVIKKILDKVKE